MLVIHLLHRVVACGIEVVCEDNRTEEYQDDEETDWTGNATRELFVSQDEVICIVMKRLL